MDEYGKVLYSGDGFVDLPVVKQRLNVKKSLLVRAKKDPKDATVIIRAHKNVATKYVREMLQMCQELGFETFAFRAASEARKD
jgi:biopolymer transport protein ExbD